MSQPICKLCHKAEPPINAAADYEEVKGFVRKRDAGGPNTIRLRSPTSQWAHKTCVDAAQSKINVGQGSLL